MDESSPVTEAQKALAILQFLKLWKYGHKGFYDLLVKMAEIHEVKNKAYRTTESLGNFFECERFGVEAWKGCLVRMADKWSRVCTLANRIDDPEYADAVKLEGLEDTLIDLANYSLICILLLRERKNGQNNNIS